MATRDIRLYASDAHAASRIIESFQMLHRSAALAESESIRVRSIQDQSGHNELDTDVDSIVRRQRSLQKQRRLSGSDFRIPVALARGGLVSYGGPDHVLMVNFTSHMIALLKTPRAAAPEVAVDVMTAASQLDDTESAATPDALLHQIASMSTETEHISLATRKSILSARPSTMTRSSQYLVSSSTSNFGGFVWKFNAAEIANVEIDSQDSNVVVVTVRPQ